MSKIYVPKIHSLLVRRCKYSATERLQTKEKNYFNLKSYGITCLAIIVAAFSVCSVQDIFTSDDTQNATANLMFGNIRTNTIINLGFSQEIYWYIHSGIHDAKINIPPEGSLLHKISS
ncbi:MAG: hypothetical protein IPJ51_24285 [Saprospiraceae bacterium]|nr:hypothetical protein [Saprospiraceae bacterium]